VLDDPIEALAAQLKARNVEIDPGTLAEAIHAAGLMLFDEAHHRAMGDDFERRVRQAT
jgi:hypothetical protein